MKCAECDEVERRRELEKIIVAFCKKQLSFAELKAVARAIEKDQKS